MSILYLIDKVPNIIDKNLFLDCDDLKALGSLPTPMGGVLSVRDLSKMRDFLNQRTDSFIKSPDSEVVRLKIL